MAFGQPSWIARHLLGDDLAPRFGWVRVLTTMYGSTSGPFKGIGGAAMTDFTITALVGLDPAGGAEIALFFADEKFLGWSQGPATPDLLGRLTYIDVDAPGLNTDPITCPVALPDRYTAAPRRPQTADSTQEPRT